MISGWYESEYGACDIIIDSAKDVECLTQSIYLKYGDECVGVDMELEGEYDDGTDVSETMMAIFEDLDFLSNIKG